MSEYLHDREHSYERSIEKDQEYFVSFFEQRKFGRELSIWNQCESLIKRLSPDHPLRKKIDALPRWQHVRSIDDIHELFQAMLEYQVSPISIDYAWNLPDSDVLKPIKHYVLQLYSPIGLIRNQTRFGQLPTERQDHILHDLKVAYHDSYIAFTQNRKPVPFFVIPHQLASNVPPLKERDPNTYRNVTQRYYDLISTGAIGYTTLRDRLILPNHFSGPVSPQSVLSANRLQIDYQDIDSPYWDLFQ